MTEQELKAKIDKRQAIIDRLIERQKEDLSIYYKTDPKVEKDVYNIRKEKIMSVVFKELGVNQKEVFRRNYNGKVNRVRTNATARQCYFYFVKRFSDSALKKVGRISLPNMELIYDHSTVIHALKSWQDLIDTDRTYSAAHKRIYKQLEFINKYNVS